MRWLWEHVLKPVLKGAWWVLSSSVQWAVQHPTASAIIGATAIVGALFVDGTARSAAFTWGLAMVLGAAYGWARNAINAYRAAEIARRARWAARLGSVHPGLGLVYLLTQ